MNLHVVLSLCIVMATVVIAVLQGSRLGDLKEERVTLEEEAVALGLSLDGAPPAKSDVAAAASGAAKGARRSGAGPGTSAAASADPKAAASEFARELFDLVDRMNKLEERGEEPSLEQRRVLMGTINRFLDLDPAAIPFLMDEISAYRGIEESDKRNILMFAMMSLSQTAPERALDLYLNSGDLLGKEGESEHMVGMALGSWAKRDPEATLDWLDRNGASLTEDTVQGVRSFAIAAAFGTDPEYAAGLALELEKDQLIELSGQIGRLMQTPENQLALLRRLDGQLGDLPGNPSDLSDELLDTATNDQVLHGALLLGLGSTLATQSFDQAAGFLDTASLDATEKLIVARGLAERARELNDPGSWLPWIHDNSPAGTHRDETVSEVVESWTQRDFRSTAAWIADQPDGPLRHRATFSFAQTVAPHEPDSAAEWALTLPASPERTDLLRSIHGQWQAKDPAAASAFAQQNDLTP